MKTAAETPNTTAINASPEIRAFIYQQLTDLDGLLPQGSNISIVVDDPSFITAKTSVPKKTTQKNKIKKDIVLANKPETAKKKIIIQLDTPVGNLIVESAHADIYKAIQSAKENLRSQLMALQNFISGVDRDQQIDNIIAHRYLH